MAGKALNRLKLVVTDKDKKYAELEAEHANLSEITLSWHEHNDELQSELEGKQIEVEKMQEKYRELERQFVGKQGELDDLQQNRANGDGDAKGRIDRLEQELNAKQEDLQSTQQLYERKLSKKHEEISSLISKQQQLEEELRKKQIVIEHGRSLEKTQEEELHARQVEIDSLRLRHDQLKPSHQQELHEKQQELDVIRLEHKELQNDHKSKQAQIDVAWSKFNDLRQHLDKKTNEANDMKAQHGRFEIELEVKQGEIDGLVQEREQLNQGLQAKMTESDDARARCVRMEQSMKNQKGELDKLRSQIGKHERETTHERNITDSLRLGIQKLEQQLKAKQAAIDKFSTQFKLVENDLADKRKELNENYRRYNQLKQDFTSKCNEINVLDSSHKQLEQVLELKKDESDSVEARCRQLEMEKVAERDIIRGANKRIEDQEWNIAEKRNEIDALKSRFEELQEDHAKTKRELFTSQTSIQTLECENHKASLHDLCGTYQILLIDAHHMLFTDDALCSLDGGFGLAKELQQRMRAWTDFYSDLKTTFRIMIYGKTDKLAIGLSGSHHYPRWQALTKGYSRSFSTFMDEFNSIDPRIEFIEMTSSQQLVSTKTKSLVEMYIKDSRCNALVFGCEPCDDWGTLYNTQSQRKASLRPLLPSPSCRSLEGNDRLPPTDFSDLFRRARWKGLLDNTPSSRKCVNDANHHPDPSDALPTPCSSLDRDSEHATRAFELPQDSNLVTKQVEELILEAKQANTVSQGSERTSHDAYGTHNDYQSYVHVPEESKGEESIRSSCDTIQAVNSVQVQSRSRIPPSSISSNLTETQTAKVVLNAPVQKTSLKWIKPPDRKSLPLPSKPRFSPHEGAASTSIPPQEWPPIQPPFKHTPPSSPRVNAPTSSIPPPVPPMQHDAEGNRLDPPMPPVLGDTFNSVSDKHCCNNHYLRGGCNYKNCRHEHKLVLTKEELEALRWCGRSLVCRNGRKCRDPTCHAGHACPRIECDRKKCNFPPDWHDRDNRKDRPNKRQREADPSGEKVGGVLPSDIAFRTPRNKQERQSEVSKMRELGMDEVQPRGDLEWKEHMTPREIAAKRASEWGGGPMWVKHGPACDVPVKVNVNGMKRSASSDASPAAKRVDVWGRRW